MENPSTPPAPHDVRVAAERVLAVSLGKVRLDSGTTLSSSDRSAVYRFRTEDGPEGTPASVIVKQALATGRESSGSGEPSPVERLSSEWASLQLLGEVAPEHPIAPRFLGGDQEAAIVVMEDLGSFGHGLSDALLGDDSDAARSDLLAYSATIGRLHARTSAHVDRFRRIRDDLGATDAGPGYDWLAPGMHAMLDPPELPYPAGLDDDLAILVAHLANPGPFAALIHGDPCPDNWWRTGKSDRLMDLEFARVGHALLDGVYGRVPFPTCWCIGRLPEEVTRAMEHAYRSELVQGCVAARDDAAYRQGVAEACAYWLIFTCRWVPMATLLDEDPEWGTGTFRQRLLARLQVVIQSTRDAGHLTALGSAAEALVRELHGQWDGDISPLPLYPAFRST